MNKRAADWINPLGPTAEEILEQSLRDDPELAEAAERLAISEAIAEKVILGRTRMGYTQKQLAEIIRTKDSKISLIESGEHIPHASTLQKLALALEIKFEFPMTAPVRKASAPRRVYSSGNGSSAALPMAAASRNGNRSLR